jgi:hypothetical protein
VQPYAAICSHAEGAPLENSYENGLRHGLIAWAFLCGKKEWRTAFTYFPRRAASIDFWIASQVSAAASSSLESA